MKFDIFFSICQTEVDGYLPSERVMFENFFDQLHLADHLGFETAWVAESHLSCQVQKQNPGAVIPHFKGEIGLNTDILQLAHRIFAQTKNLQVGSAIRNILCNGGPIAHAEAVKTFLSLHGLNENEHRKLFLGFAAGRFPFSNTPYGIRPRTFTEKTAWPVLKNKIFLEATEIFLRFLKGDVFDSRSVAPKVLTAADFREKQEWEQVVMIHKKENAELANEKITEIKVPAFWMFDKVGVIPKESRLDLLQLVVGSHDTKAQILANQYLPSWVFNLSITSSTTIEDTHHRMEQHFHPEGGLWQRQFIPRTTLVFLDNSPGVSDSERTQRAKRTAEKVLKNYWLALEGTINSAKVQGAVDNAIVGHPKQVVEQLKARYHSDDRLMIWFDFNNHDNDAVKTSMTDFSEKVMPELAT